jgi:hypothetical protein
MTDRKSSARAPKHLANVTNVLTTNSGRIGTAWFEKC